MTINIFDYIRDFNTKHTWPYIIIHHAAMEDGNANDWLAIKKWHTGQIGNPDSTSLDYNPYIKKPDRDIGYHFGIEKVNARLVYQIGRSIDWDGAHTIGMNRIALGICVIGNFDVAIPTDEHYFLCASLCRALMYKFEIPIINIKPHRDYATKTCPGKLFDMAKLITNINGKNNTSK
jgi:hypothetical protein